MSYTQRNAVKKQFLELLLRKGQTAIDINPVSPGVLIPEEFTAQETLRLNLSYRHGAQLSLDSDGIVAVLSFSAKNFRCVLPWASVYQMVSRTGPDCRYWIEDIPDAVKHRMMAEAFEAGRVRVILPA